VTEGDFILDVPRVEARYEERSWPWAEANRGAVEANWERRRVASPGVFDGRVLMIGSLDRDGETLRTTFFPVRYKSFLAWIDLGFPDRAVANGFAMGALRGSDGPFVLGEMGPRTANAGKVYFASGTPDLSDVRPDGTVDLAGSVTRELHEETGLEPDRHYRVGEGWTVVRSGGLVAFMRPVAGLEPAAALRDRILGAIEAQADPELSGVRLAAGAGDIDDQAMPAYLQAYLRRAFGGVV
jgi:8-oxo-dGTP pyrophosphatase MutT (NUDIX family)